MIISNSLLSGKIRQCFVFLIIAILPILTAACSESTEPEPKEMNGLIGRVVDSSGVALDSVSIFCYYSFYPGSIPEYEVSLPKRLNKTAGFDFSFSGNYPNPVYNSTYIKFSLPGKSNVNILVAREQDGKTFYSYSGLYDGGLYQYRLKNIVDSLKLKNGPYTLSYSAISDSSRKFNASCRFFVVSDLGAPNAATNVRGEYYLPYSEARVGDSIFMQTYDYHEYYKQIFGNNTSLYVKRRGYKPLEMQIPLFRNLLLRQDIVLYKEEKK